MMTNQYESVRPNGRQCPFCTGRLLRQFEAIPHDATKEEKKLVIMECVPCQVAWQWPIVRSEQDSISYFSKKFSEKEEGTYFDQNVKKKISLLQLDFISDLRAFKGKLLDVGAGDGTFVSEAARRGWKAVGVEPSIQSDSGTKKGATGAKLIRGTLDNIPKNSKFDVVTMWDLIEHVETPLDLIRNALKFVKTGGWLIIETGNYQSANRIQSGADWWAYQLDHRWYHAPDVLEKKLRELGIEEFVYAKRVLRPWWNGKPSYSGPSKLGHIKKIVQNPFYVVSEIRKYIALKNAAKKWKKWSGLGIFTVAARK